MSTDLDDLDTLADELGRAAGSLPSAPRREPPRDEGKRLATIARGPDEELRIVWASYEGKPYVGIRLWKRDGSGAWWPDPKRGLSVRVRELSAFALGIVAAIREAKAAEGGRS